LARWFGVGEGVVEPVGEQEEYEALKFEGGKEAPMGHGPVLVLRRAETPFHWAEKSGAKEMWEKMRSKSNGRLRTNVFERDTRDLLIMANFTYLTLGTLPVKNVRKFGFCGFVNMLESIFGSFEKMARLGILPPMQVNATRLLV
jgi:hypothetical protein